jgi:hypothetical protein
MSFISTLGPLSIVKQYCFCVKFTDFTTDLENNFIQWGVGKGYYRLSKLGIIGAYKDIPKKITDILKDKKIISNMLKYGRLSDLVELEDISFVISIFTLLFITEFQRNPGCYITNLLFFELLTRGVLPSGEEFVYYPMRKQDSTNFSRHINKKFHTLYLYDNVGYEAVNNPVLYGELDLLLFYLENYNYDQIANLYKYKIISTKAIFKMFDQLSRDFYGAEFSPVVDCDNYKGYMDTEGFVKIDLKSYIIDEINFLKSNNYNDNRQRLYIQLQHYKEYRDLKKLKSIIEGLEEEGIKNGEDIIEYLDLDY